MICACLRRRRWTHLGDRDDIAIVGTDLAEAYAPNPDGVGVIECPVINAYRRPQGSRNPHKSYGYLRTRNSRGRWPMPSTTYRPRATPRPMPARESNGRASSGVVAEIRRSGGGNIERAGPLRWQGSFHSQCCLADLMA